METKDLAQKSMEEFAKHVLAEEEKEEITEGTGYILRKLTAGYGFILQDNGEDIFFHSTGVLHKEFNDLKEGERVKFLIKQTPRGPQAIGIEAEV